MKKKVLVMLMSLAMLFGLATTSLAAYDSDYTPPEPTTPTTPVTPEPTPEPEPEPAPVEEVKVEVKVDTAVDAGGNAVEVSVGAIDAETLAAEQPVVAEKIEETKAAVAGIATAATPEEKEEAVSAYFDKQGAAVKEAITAAIAESAEVSSMADIEPVVVAPVKVDSAAFEDGQSVTMTIAMPNEFTAYNLTEDSFVCAELVDADGNVHIVTFKVVDGKLVGDFPTAGVIGNFWVGSSVTAPQTGNTNLEGIAVCGIVLCAAVLLFSVKRFKRA